ncbi:MAG: methionyl-tRNA formyltransferase [Gammaproteobacteria bacterium]
MTNPPLRIAFAGTPEFAAISLKALIKAGQHDLVAVFTQPDRPAGRGRKIQKSAVKEVAELHGLTILQPQTFKSPETLETLQNLNLDLLIVVAFGQILPKTILDTPRLGCINVHGSLLPRWRGAAPVQRSIAEGDTESGITIMQMAESLDSGPMYSKTSCNIDQSDTGQTLHDKLANLGAESLLETLSTIADGSAKLVIQDESQVTYASKLTKAEAEIDWDESASNIQRKIRAFNPFPVSFTELFDQKVRVWEAEVMQSNCSGPTGTIKNISHDGIDIVTGQDLLRIKTLQLPGKRKVSVSDFVNANPDLVT